MRRAAIPSAILAFAGSTSAQIVSPQARIEHVVTTDRSAQELARRVLRANYGRVLMCYENALGGAPDLAGRVRLRMEIATDGTVPSIAVIRASRPMASVAACVAHAAQTVTFPSRAAPWQIDVEWALFVPPAPRRGRLNGWR